MLTCFLSIQFLLHTYDVLEISRNFWVYVLDSAGRPFRGRDLWKKWRLQHEKHMWCHRKIPDLNNLKLVCTLQRSLPVENFSSFVHANIFRVMISCGWNIIQWIHAFWCKMMRHYQIKKIQRLIYKANKCDMRWSLKQLLTSWI